MPGWLVDEHSIAPHVTAFDKSARQDGTFSRDDFVYNHASDVYLCPSGTMLTTTGTLVERRCSTAQANMTAKPVP